MALTFLSLTLSRMGLFRAAHGWTLPKICHTYPTMIKQYILSKEDQKYTLSKEDPKNI